MKCRIPTIQDIANDVAAKAVERSKEEREAIFQDATKQVVPLVIAYCMRTLETQYGFRGKRLNDFLDALAQVVMDSDNGGMNSIDIIWHMKEKYGVDILNKKVL